MPYQNIDLLWLDCIIMFWHPKGYFNSVWLVEILFYLYKAILNHCLGCSGGGRPRVMVVVCLCILSLLTWLPQHCVCAMGSLHTTSISSNSGRFDVKLRCSIIAFFADSAVILVLDMHSKPCHIIAISFRVHTCTYVTKQRR